jgi:transposase
MEGKYVKKTAKKAKERGESMARSQKEPLRALTQPERDLLIQESRSRSEPASHVQRAKALLAVAEGKSFTQAAHEAGYHVGDSVAQLVKRWNAEGAAALQPRHAGGISVCYGVRQTQRILQEVEHPPNCEEEGTAVWSLSLLQRQLREAEDGLPKVSIFTLWKTLHEAGYSWQKDHSWLQTGQAKRKRKTGVVTVTDPDTVAKKKSD